MEGFPKKILVLACSRRAWALQERLRREIQACYPDTEYICKVKCSSLEEISEKEPLSVCVGEWFSKVDAIVFLCAAGIAVRCIAPCLVHKSQDPAVVVMDEAGRFSIPILSGHWGGANELAVELAGMLGAEAVVTTATDRAGKFAVDVFAAGNHLTLTDWSCAKRISAHILEGGAVGVISELPVSAGEHWPEELSTKEKGRLGIYIGRNRPEPPPFLETLHLIPRTLVLGIGCRRGITEAEIEAAVDNGLREQGADLRSVCCVASIDLKKEEEGIVSFCRRHGLEYRTFSAEALSCVEGSAAESDFVKQVTGVSNVCERSALAASGGRLTAGKRIYGRVTLAIAEKKRSLTFT
ncbi:MAG: cobalt-precorrin 5A hydrolase [Lachnospiraceae bacterium]|nr:cobalt-precorrin 5A hydrolase [Lachnospiraceae bacterium]